MEGNPLEWLREDIKEIKVELNEIREDIRGLGFFRAKIIGGILVLGVLGGFLCQLLYAYVGRN